MRRVLFPPPPTLTEAWRRCYSSLFSKIQLLVYSVASLTLQSPFGFSFIYSHQALLPGSGAQTPSNTDRRIAARNLSNMNSPQKRWKYSVWKWQFSVDHGVVKSDDQTESKR